METSSCHVLGAVYGTLQKHNIKDTGGRSRKKHERKKRLMTEDEAKEGNRDPIPFFLTILIGIKREASKLKLYTVLCM